jgi:hypothetical protein
VQNRITLTTWNTVLRDHIEVHIFRLYFCPDRLMWYSLALVKSLTITSSNSHHSCFIINAFALLSSSS